MLQKCGGKDLSRSSEEAQAARGWVREQIQAWVNKPTQNKDGLYPLHFASFIGIAKLIKLLIRNGANIYAKNPAGFTMMHVASQGDSAYSLTYFRSLGLSINDRDNN